MRELELQNVPSESQVTVPIEYKGYTFEEALRLDVYVDRCLIIENKVVSQVLPIHKAQLLSYMRLLNAPIGLIINYNEQILKNGITRLILKGADKP